MVFFIEYRAFFQFAALTNYFFALTINQFSQRIHPISVESSGFRQRPVTCEEDGEPFADKMTRLTAQLKEQFEQSDHLEAEIKKNLAGLGYEV